ncbi:MULTISPECIES: SufD family Fe-S cluster assembly protein [unclassified Lacticaseibacillus]|uniref:SufD family Fe-S cluster assembly protein n=1 Tax=unclassified Lacticaseibacillus TaxID=2759744 RepID=UPI00194550C7|nr:MULTISPECIES: SufD family Fe-S cluster assembly protein [unclassified Lacticaseibacillus]
MIKRLPLANTPKIPLARYMKEVKDSQPVAAMTVTAPSAITVSHPAEASGFPRRISLDEWLTASPQQITEITVPAGYASAEPFRVTGPTDGGGLLLIHVGAFAHVAFQERWASAGTNLGVGVLVDIGEDAQVDWLTYDGFQANMVLASRTAELADRATLNWTLAGFAQNSGATLINVNLRGTGASATVNVGVLASGRQHVGYTTAMTNYGRKSKGHINQRGVIVGKAHLIFNGIGHIIKGARGSDNQQENRVLMLGKDSRGDADPILLIDENDVTAGHAASVTRVDKAQMYYLMSRGLPEALAQRLVIRGFLEAGLLEITDKDLKADLFRQIDETLVNTDE